MPTVESPVAHEQPIQPVGKAANGSHIIPFAQLRNASPRQLLAQGYDPSTRELYLSDDDYVIAFSMPKAQFHSLPTYERNQMKRSVGLA